MPSRKSWRFARPRASLTRLEVRRTLCWRKRSCEVSYIQRRAGDHHGRIVTIGQLVLFSTETGDAWLLDPADGLAARLARDGEREPIHIEETDTTFAIRWEGRYRIEGPTFVYSENDSGRVTTMLGYPTDQLAQIG